MAANSPSTAATLALIADDMQEVDKVIASRLQSAVPLVGEVARYIISAGGKRLRPALLLLMSGALGYTGSQRFNLAAVVEFIHTATLLHDDVVDESTLRRGRPTANENFGNPASVLVGDFLYSRAFQMMVETSSLRVMEILAEATNVIAEGEVQQLMNTHDASLSESGYLNVIRSKTAKLFERGVGARMFIHAELVDRPFFARHRHRDNLLRQNAVLLRLRGTLLAAQRERVLIGTADI